MITGLAVAREREQPGHSAEDIGASAHASSGWVPVPGSHMSANFY